MRGNVLILSIAVVPLFAVSALAVDKVIIVPQNSLLLTGEKDCNGDKYGTAYMNSCATCVGGNTGIQPFDCVTSLSGKIWMDRNLGASMVAMSLTDSEAYGDLYQWGRLTDGHEQRTSPTTDVLSSTDVPGHGSFITNSATPFDWRSPQNDNLWQGVSGTNNPCPTGFRIPTSAEWETERLSWSSNNAAGAFASPLKLVLSGYRKQSDGSLSSEGTSGYYWSSTVDEIYSDILDVSTGNTDIYREQRSYSFSVRCIKD